MQKRTQYGRTLLLLTVVSLAGCQLPSIAPKTNPAPEPLAPSGATSEVKTTAAGGRFIQTATDSVWVPTQYSTQSSEDIVIPFSESWTQELPTSRSLEMFARIDFPYPAGGTYVMNVWVNGQPITAGLTNKPGNWFVNAWSLNYTPNFEINNTPAAGGYYFPNGQACRYVWDVSSYVNDSPTMQVRVQNKGEYLKRPIVIQFKTVPPVEMKIDTPFFSPNQDGTLDTAAGSLKAQGPWKLSVVDHGEITTGTGNSDLNWNGEVNGVKLPDGEYTLRLEDANNPSSKAEGKVVIDTVAPKIENVMVDGKGRKAIIERINPEVKAIITDELSKFEGVENVELKFVRNIDKYTTNVYNDSKNFDLNSGSFSYLTPFKEDSVLYPGDHLLEVTAKDRAGNKATVKQDYIVFMRTLYSGVPTENDPRPAIAGNPITTSSNSQLRANSLSVNGLASPSLEDYPVPAGLVQSGDLAVKYNVTFAERGLLPPNTPNSPPVWGYAILRAGQTVGLSATIWVFLDDIYFEAKELINRDRLWRVRSEIGDVSLSRSKLRHIKKHNELGETPEAKSEFLRKEAIMSLNRSRNNKELWTNDDSPLPERLLLLYKNVNLYQVIMERLKDETGQAYYNIDTAYGLGRFPKDQVWPDLKVQWSYAAKQVAEYYRTKDGRIQDNNPKPDFGFHSYGRIDDPEKPYEIIKSKAVVLPNAIIYKTK